MIEKNCNDLKFSSNIQADCDNRKGLSWLKKIVMIENSVVTYKQIVIIEKDYNYWKFSSNIQADCDNGKGL